MEFWCGLSALYGLCASKWCVGEDFYAIHNLEEEFGGSRFVTTIWKLNGVISDLNLIDLKLLNVKLSWLNIGSLVVSSRLDRFLLLNTKI